MYMTMSHFADVDELRLSYIRGLYKRRNMIINAFLKLNRPATTYDIKRYLDGESDQKNTVSLRQIQRILPQLKKEGILGKSLKSHEYFILDKHKESIRYFADTFGESILRSIMDAAHYEPGAHSMEYNLEWLIENFGLYIVYCFVEATRPMPIYPSRSSMDDLPYHWVKNVFNPDIMLQYFLAVVRSGPAEPSYFLSNDEIDKITSILKKEYPLVHERVVEGREGFTKERIR